MKRSRWAPAALAAVALLGCGRLDSASDGGPGLPEDLLTTEDHVVLIEEAAPAFGELVDIGDGLHLRLELGGVSSDRLGPWLTVTAHLENRGSQAWAYPGISISCTEGEGNGVTNPSDVPHDRAITAGESADLELRLALPGDLRVGEEIPPCEGEASLTIHQYRGESQTLTDGWPIPPELVDALNDARPDPPVSDAEPAGPIQDADRPYAWVNEDGYCCGYTVLLVRGLGTSQVLEALGGVRLSAGTLEMEERWDLHDEGIELETYEEPPVVTVAELDGGVVVFAPFGHFIAAPALRALSRGGVAATYGNTVEGDDHIVVARKGRLIRQYDPFLDESWDDDGPLPEEAGLDLQDDTGPASWTLLERLTDIHVDQDWLEGPQPTYVLRH